MASVERGLSHDSTIYSYQLVKKIRTATLLRCCLRYCSCLLDRQCAAGSGGSLYRMLSRRTGASGVRRHHFSENRAAGAP
jgi:hypothetical protein